MAKSPGALGEPSHDYLFSDSIYLQALYNDILGQTDKYLTNGSKFGLLLNYGDYSMEFSSSWRFVTPALKEHNFSDYNLSSPPGVFADWLATNVTVAKKFDLDERNFITGQFSIGYDHFGNKAAKPVQQGIHRGLGIDHEIYDYQGQIRAEHFSKGVELAYVRYFTKSFQLKSALGYVDNFLTRDLYYEQYALANVSSSFKFSMSYKHVSQKDGEIDLNLRPARNEYGLGLLLFDIYKPGVRYVSPYIKGDDTRQIITDFLSFQIQF